MNYYAVRVGRQPGIYTSWPECESQVKSYPGASYKKFKSRAEALEFISPGQPVERLGQAQPETKIREAEEAYLKEVSSLEDGEAIAYVDGSFKLEDFSYSYGVVLITRDGEEGFSGRDNDQDLASMRNVSGELKAAMVAMDLARLRGYRKLYLHYDYKGIEEWALDRWKANKPGTKKYKEFYARISQELEVEFIKVRAHTGVHYNEEADRLAKEAL